MSARDTWRYELAAQVIVSQLCDRLYRHIPGIDSSSYHATRMRQKSNVLLAELLDENPKLENTLNHARHLRPAFETLVFASYLCLTLKKLKNDSAEHGAYFSREQFEEEQSVLAVYAQNIDHWMEHVLKDMHASNEATTIVNQRLGRKIADYILANPLDTSEPQDPPPLPKPRPRSR